MKFDLAKEIDGEIPVAGDHCNSFLAKLRPRVEVRELPVASVLFVKMEPSVPGHGSASLTQERSGSRLGGSSPQRRRSGTCWRD
jgi:hypothetical protein